MHAIPAQDKGLKMPYYKPCFNCAADKAECKRRAEIKDAISGLHVRSISFRCEIRQQFFRPGQRVSFSWGKLAGYDPANERETFCTVYFKGTISHEKDRSSRFVVRVDDGQDFDGVRPEDIFTNGNFISVRTRDIYAIDEPDVYICAECGLFYGEQPDDWHCSGCAQSLPNAKG